MIGSETKSNKVLLRTENLLAGNPEFLQNTALFATAQLSRNKGVLVKIYTTTTEINANADIIWAILTDSSTYHDWNKSVEKVEGKIALGEKIKVYAKISPERAFPVKVQEFVPSKKMVWRGGMPLGLFKGVRTFTLTYKNKGQVKFLMQEVFSGLISPIIVRSMPDLTESFEQFATSLKAKAESSA